jgi:protoporphyrinogen oxidase
VPGAPGSFRNGLDPRSFEVAGPPESYDAVAACVPSDVFSELLDESLAAEVGDDYLGKLRSIDYFTALNLLLELDRPLTQSFWLNIADRRVPFVGVIEHTNFVGSERYGGRCFAHITNYLAPDHPLTRLSPDELFEAYLPGLEVVNPDFSRDWVKQRWRFAEPAGQPIVDVGYPERIPPRQTPAPGLLLVNTTQVYPEDRGTNYAVRDGEICAQEIAALRPVASVSPAGAPRAG